MNMNNEKKVCSICGYPIEDPFDAGGCNPWPVADCEEDGPCCHFCDAAVVIPARIALSEAAHEMEEDGLDEAEINYQIDNVVLPNILERAEWNIEEVKRTQAMLRG